MNIEAYQDYYSKLYVQFEMVKLLRNKEFSALKMKDITKRGMNVRGMNCGGLDYLKGNAHRFELFKFPHKFYFSVATMEIMPALDWNLKTRKQQYKHFNDTFAENMKGYDFVLDLDAEIGEFEKVKESAFEIWDVLEEFKLPFSCKFSGKKGFHFMIEWPAFTTYFEANELRPTDAPMLFNEIAENLKEICNVPHLDTSVYDLRRIFKLDYSLDNYNGWRMALPVTGDMLQKYQYDDYLLKNVMQRVKIKDRGRIINNKDVKLNKLWQFMDEFS